MNCISNTELELWIGFLGSIVGAAIGGFIAYKIARFQFKKQETRFIEISKKEKLDKEVQLLWHIYFDIKKDCENSKLWEKFDIIFNKRESIQGSPTSEYLLEVIRLITWDLKGFLTLLSKKDTQDHASISYELDLLWIRAEKLLDFIFEVLNKHSQFSRIITNDVANNRTECHRLINEHKRFKDSNSDKG